MPESFTLNRKRGGTVGTKLKAPLTVPLTVAEFVRQSVESPEPAPGAAPKTRKGAAGRNGIWGTFSTPEERSAYAKELAAMRKGKNMVRNRKGLPRGWNRNDADVARVTADLEADAMVKRLKALGIIDRDDTDGAEQTKAAFVILRSPGGSKREKARAAKLLLKHYHPDNEEVPN